MARRQVVSHTAQGPKFCSSIACFSFSQAYVRVQEGVIIILDVGASMSTGKSPTRLDAAKEAADLFVQQKVGASDVHMPMCA